MRTTIDRAGRLVIPKALREAAGITEGEVELVRDGAGIRIQPVIDGDTLVQERGRLVIPASGHTGLDDATVRALRDADQR
jgi:AbrB family looped-hinge helix DNA binding protein